MTPPPVAWRRVLPPVVVVVVVLTAFSNGYGFDRDEMYFAMLRPAWGYVDQPPLTPLLAHGLTSLYDGGPWLLRVPATLCGAACVLITALIARELGGAAKAQAWTAWGMATTSAVLLFGARAPHLGTRPGRLGVGLAVRAPGGATRRPPVVARRRRAGRPRDVQQAPRRRAARRHRDRPRDGRSAPPAAVAVRLGRRRPHRAARAPERHLPAHPRPAAAEDGPGPRGQQRRRRAGQHVVPADRAARAAARGDLGDRAAGVVARPSGAVLRGRRSPWSCCSRSSPARSRTTRCSSCRSRSRRGWSRCSGISAGCGGRCSRSTVRCRWCSGCRSSPSAVSARPRSPASTCSRRTPSAGRRTSTRSPRRTTRCRTRRTPS